MTRLTVTDRFLLAGLVLLWGSCFGLTVRDLVRQTATPSVFVATAATPDTGPRVLGLVPWWHAEHSELRVGDTLVSIQGRSLAGVGPVGFRGIVAEEGTPEHPATVVFERDGTRRSTALALGTLAIDWPLVPTSLSFALTAILLLLRAPPSSVVRSYFVSSMTAAIALVSLFGATVLEVSASFWLTLASSALLGPLSVRAVLHFVGREETLAARVAPWVFLLGGISHVSRIFATPLSPAIGNVLAFVVSVAWGSTVLVVLTRAYGVLDAVRRRRLKWVVLGLYIGFTPMLAASLATVVDPSLLWLYEDAIAGFLVVPIFVLVAVSRHHLFDVDRLISATVSYSILITLGSAIGFAAIPALAESTAEWLGFDPNVGHIVFGLALASVVVSLNRRFAPWLYERFFPESHALASGVHGLLRELARCETVAELSRVSGTHLAALLRPDACVIYARGASHFQPVFLRGPATPPLLEKHAHTARSLTQAHRAIRRTEIPAPPDGDDAWLRALNPEVCVPVLRDGRLLAIVVLGKKRSEAPYSDEDLALLSTLSEAVSSEIHRIVGGDDGSTKEVAVLRARQQAIDDDLQAAAEVQRSHMPSDAPDLPDVRFAWEFSPCEAVGGDLLQVQAIDDRHVAFYVVDVSGHGIAAAMLSVSIAERLTQQEGLLTEAPGAGDTPGIRPPARVLESLDERYPIERSAKFFTIFYAILDRKTQRLRYARGGHPAPILLRADGSTELLEEGGTIIGLGGLVPFEEGETTLQPGDRLYVYSDGVTEAAGETEEMFGEARLGALLNRVRAQSLQDACHAVLQEIRAFCAPEAPGDDVTILGVEYSGPARSS